MHADGGQGKICDLWRGIIAAILVAIVFSALSPRLRADGGPLNFGRPVVLSGNTQGNLSQMIIDSEGNLDVAYTLQEGENGTRDLYFVRSTDNGSSFSSPLKVSLHASGDFSMAVESPCLIDFAYLDMGEPPAPPSLGVPAAISINFAQSTDCGADFTTTVITSTALRTLYPSLVYTRLVINQGVAQVIWETGYGLNYSQRNADGTFTPPALIAPDPPVADGAPGGLQMAVSPDGHTDIAWYVLDISTTQDGGVFFLDSTRGGKPINIDGSGSDIETQLAIDAQSNVNLLWVDWPGENPTGTLEFSRSVGQSGVFSPPRALFPAMEAQIAIDDDGNIGLDWSQRQNGNDALFFSRSTDGGATFSAPVQIGNSVPSSGISPAGQLVLNGNSVYVLYFQNADLWYSFSIDGGNTFSTPANITNDGQNGGELKVRANAQGDIFATWIKGTPEAVFFDRGIPEMNFSITAAPSTQSTLPGGAANFPLTLTAAGGFSNPVNLSCTNLPPDVTCSFNPFSVTPVSSGSNAAVTLTTPPTLAQGNYSVTVSASGGSITHTQDLQLAVGGVTSSISPTSATVAAGSSANFAVALNSTGGFAGQLAMACSGLPSGMTCSFNPAEINIAANGASFSMLTVNVASQPQESKTSDAKGNWLETVSRELPLVTACVALFGVFVAFAVIVSGMARRSFLRATGRYAPPRPISRRRELLLGFASFAGVLVLAISLISCSGATTKTSSADAGTGASAAGSGSTSSSGTGTTGTTGTGAGGTGTTGGSGGSGGSGASGGTGGSGGSGGTGSSGGSGGSSGSGSSGSGSSGSGGSGSSGGSSGSGSAGSGSTGSGSSSAGSVTSQITIQAQSNGATVTLGTISITVP